MNLKSTKILAPIITIIIAIIIYLNYNLLSNITIFFSVNKSIWETSKILFTAVIIYGLIDYLIMQKYKIIYNNFFLSLFISSFTSIILYFINIKLPFILNIILTISIIYIINYYIQKRNNIKILNIISLILIITTYIIYGYFTYHPLLIPYFYDNTQHKYGINQYII